MKRGNGKLGRGTVKWGEEGENKRSRRICEGGEWIGGKRSREEKKRGRKEEKVTKPEESYISTCPARLFPYRSSLISHNNLGR